MMKQHRPKIAKYAATWKGLAAETKFFCFSVFMLLLSQLWLSHRHSQKALEAMEGDIVGQNKASHESTLSRSLSSFQQASQEYTLNRIRLNLTSDDQVSQEQLQRKILDFYSSPPAWLKDYATWHGQKMAQLTPENYKHQRFLIARCLGVDRQRCGDAAHRLMSIPAALLMAKQTNRIFLIKWTQPAALENYLVPPTDQEYYIDWRIPDWLQAELGDFESYTNIITLCHMRTLSRANDPSEPVVMLRHLTRDHGSHYYNNFVNPGEPNFRIAFGLVWNVMFRPSPQVQSLLDANMQALGIATNSYVMAQLRSLTEETAEKLHGLAKSSIDCLSSLQAANAQSQVVVTSESQAVLDTAMEMQGLDKEVLGLKTSSSILSLDKDTEEWRNRTKDDYYPAFVYLYIMANSKCVSYYDDKDGRWGSLISQNPLCSALMKFRPPSSVICEKVNSWSVAPGLLPDTEKEPNAVIADVVGAAAAVMDAADSNHGDAYKAVAAQMAVLDSEDDKTVYWEPLPEFPDWMNDYFAWHNEARAKLNEDNWESYRYLVLRCLATDERCGGASDRLQSFLLGILFASLGERLLLIHWERPAPLEEFLVPPKAGLDWRMPAWLDEKLDYDRARMIISKAFKPVTRDSLLVTMRHQMFWPEFYDERKQGNERSYEDIFHDAWHRFFEPSLPVQALTEKTMRDLGIETGKYVAVHVRAKYTKDKTGDHSLVHNAINCASQLRPGWPIYFASDSAKVVETAINYGKSVGGKVVARENEKEPLHLDRGEEFLNHQKRFTGYSDLAASNYYDVFVDMYLLANSECVSIGFGGYGRLGSMLSFNRTCSMNYLKSQCEWTSG